MWPIANSLSEKDMWAADVFKMPLKIQPVATINVSGEKLYKEEIRRKEFPLVCLAMDQMELATVRQNIPL